MKVSQAIESVQESTQTQTQHRITFVDEFTGATTLITTGHVQLDAAKQSEGVTWIDEDHRSTIAFTTHFNVDPLGFYD